MRSVVLILFLIVAVFFGSTHASAFSHQHDAGHVAQAAHHDAVPEDAVPDVDHDPAPAGSGDPGQLSHSHCAMASLAGVSAIDAPINQIRVPAQSLVVIAMSSLGIPPPLEPPSV